MKHVIIVVHAISFLLGFSCILGSILIYMKNKKREVKTYIYFLIALTLILIEQAVSSYLNINQINSVLLKIIMNMLSGLSCGLLIFFLPQFVHDFFEKKMEKKIKRYFWILANVPVVVMTLYYISHLQFIATALANTALLASVLYSVIMGFKLLPGINEERKKVVRNLLIMTVVMFPYILLDTWIEKLPYIGRDFPYGIMSMSVFYGTFNFMTLYYGLKEFKTLLINPEADKEPAQQNSTIDDFCTHHEITAREKEVIGLIMKGYSYNKISDELIISLSTTKSHIYNIYQKTNVKSKVELINAVHAYMNEHAKETAS